MSLIVQDRMWFILIPFVHLVKFQFLAQFQVDHLPQSVVSGLTLFLCEFAGFAYKVINCFISIST